MDLRSIPSPSQALWLGDFLFNVMIGKKMLHEVQHDTHRV